MACCKESCGKNLQLQADALKVLNEQEKRKYMTKIMEKNKQLKVLRITVNRKNSKIKILLAAIKKVNIISDESFQILNNELEKCLLRYSKMNTKIKTDQHMESDTTTR